MSWPRADSQSELSECEDVLARGLGYPVYPPDSPGYSEHRVNYVIGDHTPVTLAMEAVTQIAQLRAQIGSLGVSTEDTEQVSCTNGTDQK